jgi:UDP-GlcNAc:undecaprenyl-phosphate/decaprenyl-phosphate GlcNAc-1-phosphate transferase
MLYSGIPSQESKIAAAATKVTVIIPAYNAQAAIADTVRAAAALPGVIQVIVVDDGSHDATAECARAAGAQVIILEHNSGKGAALRAGLEEAARLRFASDATAPENSRPAEDELVLFLDADLGESAHLAAALIPPVARGEAEMAIAHFVKEQVSGSRFQVSGSKTQVSGVGFQVSGSETDNQSDDSETGLSLTPDSRPRTPDAKPGGFGTVVRLARRGIWALTGLRMQSPLSGQRCLPLALAREAGIAGHFGVEVGLTLEVARRGGRIVEIPLAMSHAVTGRDAAGWLHRGGQFWDALGTLADAAYGWGWPGLEKNARRVRIEVWLLALFGFLAAAHFSGGDFLTKTAIGVLLALVLMPLLAMVNLRLGWVRQNYLGRRVLNSFGLILPLVWLATFRIEPLAKESSTALVLVVVWALLGLLDDVYGTGGARGFRGHIRALLHLRITTGGAKLLFGGLVSLFAGWMAITTGGWLMMLLNGLIIALCTNLLNLLDLRPGRALKGFFLLGICAWIIAPHTAVLLAPLFAAAIIYSPLDLSMRAMLGDVGSNTLGALVGLALVLALGLPAKLVLLVLLIAIHVYAEIGSISRLIDRVAPLRWIDMLGRARE